MYKKILAGVHKKYPIIIGKKSICKEFLPKAIKNNSKVMIITDFGVPKEIIESIDKILKKESKFVKIHKIALIPFSFSSSKTIFALVLIDKKINSLIIFCCLESIFFKLFLNK